MCWNEKDWGLNTHQGTMVTRQRWTQWDNNKGRRRTKIGNKKYHKETPWHISGSFLNTCDPPHYIIVSSHFLFITLCCCFFLCPVLSPCHHSLGRPPGLLVLRSRIREESLAFEDMLRAAADIASRLESSAQALHTSFTKQMKDIVKIHRWESIEKCFEKCLRIILELVNDGWHSVRSQIQEIYPLAIL